MIADNAFSPRKFDRILFWEPCLSPHKADFFEALARLNPDMEIVCCADQDVLDDRKRMGWTVPEPQGYQNIVSPEGSVITAIVSRLPLTTLHIFSGIRWVPTLIKGITAVKLHQAAYAIMSEPRELGGLPGKLRLLHSWLTEGYHRRNAIAVLAIGSNGPPWYYAAGYSPKKVVPFAYFLSPPGTAQFAPCPWGKLRIGYLGRLVKMKGVFDLVDAVKMLKDKTQLDFAGTGPEEEALKSSCVSAGIESTFRGVLAISDIGVFFSQIDVLVLASTTKDGWGAVVSEALMAGVPVVLTPMVGASVVMKHSLFGRCVAASDPTAIRDAILDLKNAGDLSPAARPVRARKAVKVLSANAGALHLVHIIAWLEGRTTRPLEFYSTLDEHV